MRIGAAVLVVLLLGACAGAPQSRALLDGGGPQSLPVAAEVEGVPFFPQEDRWCGPAALATIQGWAGRPISQDQAAAQVYTPGSEGTHRTDIVAAARRNGLLAVPVHGLTALLAEVAAGHPVMVFQNLGLAGTPLWHYAVVVGYDLDEGVVVLRSGRDAERLTRLSTFERTWARGDGWALAVTPPGRLPVTADEPSVLAAALALERTGYPGAAAEAYAAAAERWPQSFLARFGLGNAHLATGANTAAAEAYRAALALRPKAAAVWNNLAHALHREGQTEEARSAALYALNAAETTGSDTEPYRETMQTVSAAPES